MSIDSDARNQLSRYIAGTISLADLDAWLTETAWDIEREPIATQHLTLDALRLVTEARNGDWTEDELRNHFKPPDPSL